MSDADLVAYAKRIRVQGMRGAEVRAMSDPIPMWMVKTAYLAPCYGIAYRRKDMVERLPRMNVRAQIVKVLVHIVERKP